MAGIYIHIPFCKQACHYCNFHFSTSLRYKNDFVAALLKEISLQKEYFQGEEVETIYFGGGTPSLLEDKELKQIMNALFSGFLMQPRPEITLEANPDDVSTQNLKSWREAGINRLSMGVQSFFEEDLAGMNRAHHADQSEKSIKLAQDKGFENLTIDLIYGLPLLTHKKWMKNLEQAVQLKVPHLSCYALTVEPKTPLYKMIRQQKIPDLNADVQAEQYLIMTDFLTAHSYEHYEISNFAQPGKRSLHNSSYWRGKNYLGLGPSAHSFNGRERSWNISNNLQYIQSLNQNKVPFEKEVLTPVQQLNEYIMISLRTIEGCDLAEVRNKFGADAAAKLLKNAGPFLQQSSMELKAQTLMLTREGKLLADGIAASLFF